MMRLHLSVYSDKSIPTFKPFKPFHLDVVMLPRLSDGAVLWHKYVHSLSLCHLMSWHKRPASERPGKFMTSRWQKDCSNPFREEGLAWPGWCWENTLIFVVCSDRADMRQSTRVCLRRILKYILKYHLIFDFIHHKSWDLSQTENFVIESKWEIQDEQNGNSQTWKMSKNVAAWVWEYYTR